MGGTPGASDGSAGGSGMSGTGLLSMLQQGMQNSPLGTGIAKLAQQYPQLGEALGSVGYNQPQGPQLPVGATSNPNGPQTLQDILAQRDAAAKRQSGLNDITQYGMNMAQPKMGAMPSVQLPPAFRPQVAPLAQSPMMQQAPDPGQPGGAPVFFPMFRR
jgi:hypothetical protein